MTDAFLYNKICGSICLDAADAAEIQRIMKKAKEKYVSEYHKYAITYLENRKHWKTWVGNPRRAIERSSRDDLIECLYQYYGGHRSVTLMEGLDLLLEYKRECNRDISTIDRNRATFMRYTTKELLDKDVENITESELRASIHKKIREKSAPPSLRDVKSYLQLLHAVYERLMIKGLTEHNPSRSIIANDFCSLCNTTRKHADEKTFSPTDIDRIKAEAISLSPNPRAYAIRIAIVTGLRAGELPCLRWADIHGDYLHIHKQQHMIVINGKREGFEELETTKNEKGISHGGRMVPILPELASLLDEIREFQHSAGIETDLILCEPDGSPIKKTAYERFLRRLCQRLGLSVTNNHAFRMSFNSNCLIPCGLDARERALILGHSVETNERFYSYAGTYLLDGISKKLRDGNT